MLTCYGHEVRLPQNDLAYVAFRLAAQETLCEIESRRTGQEEPDLPAGYLSEVPFLESVPLPVQVDLLADVWMRQQRPELIEASLLDAAVVYAACMTAARIAGDTPELAAAWLKDGPRRVSGRILRRAAPRLEAMFDQFWDDRDFLLIEEFQDLPPERARQIKEMLRLPDEVLDSMYAALGRWNVSPAVAANLAGLLTDTEIQAVLFLLRAFDHCAREGVAAGGSGDPDGLLPGFEDRYHGLLVGPCEPEVAETEGSCRFVEAIFVLPEGFDCTYAEWVVHFRAEARQAAVSAAAPAPVTAEQSGTATAEAERVQRALTVGLDDGTRIVARGDGWVVVDRFSSYLLDPEDASWTAGADDEDMPPAMFPSPEAAYRAWVRSEKVAEARRNRRAEALRRLGRADGGAL